MKAAAAAALVSAVFSALLATSCAPVEGPVTVEALLPDPEAEDGVRLGDVTLDTMVDVSRGTGALFDARGGLRMAGSAVGESAEAGDSFEKMRDKTRGDGGKDMSPRMSFDGTRYVAEDLVTLTYFTAWEGFEESLAFAEEMGDVSGATREHALVGIEATVVAADLFPLPLITSDNAAYAAPLDAWLTLRVVSQEGVPFAMAFPVLAHEVHHRVFHRNVFGTDDAFEVWLQRLGETSDAQERATRILQGVDEGLADLFSLAVTRDPDGLRRTFELAGGPFVAEADRRDLDGPLAAQGTYENLRDLRLDASLLRACNASGSSDIYGQGSFNFYCLGTVLARALWDGSGRDLDVLRGEVMPAVNRALPAVGEQLATGALFDVDMFLAPLVDNLPAGARRDAVCAELRVKFASLVDAGKVPACL